MTLATLTCRSSDGDVSLNAGENTYICVTSTAEDAAATKSYLITVYRLRANANTDVSLQAFTIAEATGTININDGTITSPRRNPWTCLDDEDNEDPDVAYRVRQVTVDTTADIGAIVTITPTDADTGKTGHQVDLTAGAETAIMVRVMPEDPAAQSKTYTSNVYRKNVPGSESDDATLSSLMLSGVTLMYKDDNDMDMTGFMSDVMDYTGDAGSEKTTVTAMASHLGAQSGITVTYGTDDTVAMMGDGGGYEITVGDEGAELSIMVQVRPESIDENVINDANDCIVADTHADLECYTVTVTRTEAAADPLLAEYDTNGTPGIQIDEVVQAVGDYAAGDISIEDVVHLVQLYATGG